MSYKNKKDLYENQKQRWRKRKHKVVELMGGKCSLCGYNNNIAALHLHHKDPTSKEFVWTKLKLRSWKAIHEEIIKCELLCSNCHAEVTYPDERNLIRSIH